MFPKLNIKDEEEDKDIVKVKHQPKVTKSTKRKTAIKKFKQTMDIIPENSEVDFPELEYKTPQRSSGSFEPKISKKSKSKSKKTSKLYKLLKSLSRRR
jgi:hypothetical protein